MSKINVNDIQKSRDVGKSILSFRLAAKPHKNELNAARKKFLSGKKSR